MLKVIEHHSASAGNTFIDCPQMWIIDKLFGFETEENARMKMGHAAEEAAHHALVSQITNEDDIINVSKEKYIKDHQGESHEDEYEWSGQIANAFVKELKQYGDIVSYQKEWKGITYKEAFIIGLFQILAFIPWASRAGVTITGARFLGLNRSNAAIFSMLLSIPVILASLTLILFKISYSEYSYINLQQPIFAACIACITAILAINFMMKLIRSTNFNLFIIYRIIIGFLLLFFYG